MVNSSVLQNNLSQESFTGSKTVEYVQWIIIFLIIAGFCFLLCIVTVMLSAFLLTPDLQQNARYVLFVYMLINDPVLAFFLLLGSLYLLYVPVPVCYILYTVSSKKFRLTPYNLAAMALEQYVVICYPLQHAQLCTTQRANAAFTLICSAMMIPYAAELCVMFSSFTNIFHLYIICGQEILLVINIQTLIKSVTLVLCFGLVGLVIIFTYVKIMLAALKISPQSSSASKDGKIITLHAFQYLSCMASLSSVLSQSFSIQSAEALQLSNYFTLTYVPRFLSPVIYGIWDEVLRKPLKKSLTKFYH